MAWGVSRAEEGYQAIDTRGFMHLEGCPTVLLGLLSSHDLVRARVVYSK